MSSSRRPAPVLSATHFPAALLPAEGAAAVVPARASIEAAGPEAELQPLPSRCASSMKAHSTSRIWRLGSTSSTLTPLLPQSTHVAPSPPALSSMRAWEIASSLTEAPQQGSTTGFLKSVLLIGHLSSSSTDASSSLRCELLVAFLKLASSGTIRLIEPSGIWNPPVAPSASFDATLRICTLGIPTGKRRCCCCPDSLAESPLGQF
mmetsp:Transcript_17420/g.29123  ORF Transcript_17420/g.29123 Transcript_17420/m.29123 type:complete len:206 (+) Transcript_17420:317-934(+)